MKMKETASVFHQRLLHDNSDPGKFTVYRTEDLCGVTPLPHSRRDFYKISLVTKGEGILSFADKTFHLKDGVLVFFNPMIPYSWKPLSTNDSGYHCLFTEDFISHQLKAESLSRSPLFHAEGNHVLVADEKTIKLLSGIYQQMITEMNSGYVHKYELLRSYIQIIMHEALKIEPLKEQNSGNSAARISTLFMDLLEKQFPVLSPQHSLDIKNANEFANRLAIHTNHLNRALKETTGNTTTEIISTRIIKEAKDLLRHSSWDIGEIGYCLGFEHASNFNIFFKKQTGLSPNQFRKQSVLI
ncbi:helix-turn-helix domain-containing protein [Dyadobacter frigoris]|uniref:Helix-turn-helix domain-containing protein n=1 Tax=Dyadobacter frigoris TaxID=2576211 RepID=A0A4U6CZY1_9BACT|nr:helix-turn-helix domain-containing protein [Dyadobacter frigoris]TKT90419.1 helix-turn-helix domain-containing protein [Dyadobacter frigoris]GLU51459.1 AraC family transcriptional regulator [Dyadobacter frigoris]